MATYTAKPSGHDESDYKYYAVSSSYPLSNLVGQGTNGTKYAGINLTRNAGSETYLYITFDLSAIPSNATIQSVSAAIKLYGSTTGQSRTTTREVQTYTGKTAKGTAADFSLTGSSVIVTIDDCGTWTRSELEDARIRVYLTRNSSNTTSNTYCYIQGAEFTVEYTIATTHNLTVEDNGYNVTPKGTIAVLENSTQKITIEETDMPKVTLDGADITNQFTKEAVKTDGSYSGAPTASSYAGLSSDSNEVARAVGKTAEEPYGDSLNWYGSSSATVDSQYAQYTWDLSGIPSNATNIKVACKVAGTAESTTYRHQSGGRYSVWGLCSNGTAKGSQIYTTSGSVTVIEFTDTGSWTRSELDGLQLRHYIGYYGGSTNGATLTITYNIPGSDYVYVYNLAIGTSDHTIVISSGAVTAQLYFKNNGQYVAATVYKKINGAWVEQTDLAALFEGIEPGTETKFIKA